MKRIVNFLLLAVAVFGSIGKLSAEEKDAKPAIQFEIRKAETKPADGLIETTVLGTESKVYLHPKADFTNGDVASAAVADDGNKNPAVEIVLTDEAAKRMEKVTSGHLDKPLAIMIDGKVISAPVIREAIRGRARITGGLSKSDVEKLVKQLNSQAKEAKK